MSEGESVKMGIPDEFITTYFIEDNGKRVEVKVDCRTVGVCDDYCSLIQINHCYTRREDGYCDRPFKPCSYDDALEMGMTAVRIG